MFSKFFLFKILLVCVNKNEFPQFEVAEVQANLMAKLHKKHDLFENWLSLSFGEDHTPGLHIRMQTALVVGH